MPCNKTGSNSFLYLLGRKFTIQTDHRSLEWLDQLKDSNPRLCRWSLGLQPYQYTVVHRLGKANGNASQQTSLLQERGGGVWKTSFLLRCVNS